MQLRVLLTIILCVSLVVNLSEAKKGRGRGKKIRKPGSPRVIFVTDPKRREYYNNPNGARIIKASHFDYEFILGHKIVYVCVAKGEPRPRITWFKDGIELFSHPYLQITEYHIGEDRLKSKLEITPARQMDSGTYDCEANNKYAVDRSNFKADFSTISK